MRYIAARLKLLQLDARKHTDDTWEGGQIQALIAEAARDIEAHIAKVRK